MCGIVGVAAHPGAAQLAQRTLLALQHRGQESAGIAAWDGDVRVQTGMGLVANALADLHVAGRAAIGHTRYSTTGSSRLENAQPLLFKHPRLGGGAVAHNGNLLNAAQLRASLESQGARFATSVDTEVVARLLEADSSGRWEDAIQGVLAQLSGAYSFVVLAGWRVLAARDPYGFRPLCLGRLADGTLMAVSESSALDATGAVFEREVEPGETVELNGSDAVTLARWPAARAAFCLFELVYLSHPGSIESGRRVEAVRVRMGRELAAEAPADADLVVGVPASGLAAARGYAACAGIEMAVPRPGCPRRSFIEPDASRRRNEVARKLATLVPSVEGRHVVAVDDSLVRGTTAPELVRVLRAYGARSVHLRIASPPVRFTCHMGVDIGTTAELIAYGRDEAAVAAMVGADSLRYLSLRGARRAAADSEPSRLCAACFNGAYPIPIPAAESVSKLALEPSGDVTPEA